MFNQPNEEHTKKNVKVWAARLPISLRPRTKVNFCECKTDSLRGAEPVEPVISPKRNILEASHQLVEGKRKTEFLIDIEQPERFKMAEEIGPLVEQLAKLTNALQGSAEMHQVTTEHLLSKQGNQLAKFITDQQKIASKQEENVHGTGGARLGKFSAGKLQDIGAWLDKFDYFSRFNGWPDKRKANAMPLFLEGIASPFYASLSEEVKEDYKQTADALRERFDATHLEFLERQELTNRRQKPGEDLEDYIDYVRRMSQRLNLSAKDRLHTFVGNLDPTLREYVILGSPETCEEAERPVRLKASTNIYNKKEGVIEIPKNAL